MNRISLIFLLAIGSILLNSCNEKIDEGSFAYDLEFLEKHKDLIVLKSENEMNQLIIIPDYQGRVMTSTSGGLKGRSYGWINYYLIESGKFDEHINIFGGEDRFWIGPEGGQYSIFFKNGTEFTLDNWYTPKPIDTEPFDIIEFSEDMAHLSRKMNLTNYGGFEFNIDVVRKVSLFSGAKIEKNLNIKLGSKMQFVGYESVNSIKNIGSIPWTMDSGLLSIWILGMYNPSDRTTVILPYKGSPEINNYFGPISPDKIQIRKNEILFKGDGKARTKIGLRPENVMPYIGSYDSENSVLTIVGFSFEGDTAYVNSKWEYHTHPYGGDVINTYNDGPLENGEQFGPFYELETSSPAKELKPGQAVIHVHRTYHFEGAFDELNTISKKVLGVDLSEILSAWI